MKIITGTIVFVTKNEKVLLAKKARVLGIGKWNGYGGSLEPQDSTLKDCAVREFNEESNGASIKKEFLTKVGEIIFHHGEKLEFTAHIYIADDIVGEPKTSGEMVDPTWFPIDNIPSSDEFMESDKFWIHRILRGDKIKGEVWYDNDFKLLTFNLDSVEIL